MSYQSYRYLRDEPYSPEPYAPTKPQPSLSAYKPTKEDLGSEEAPLPADHTKRLRAWIKPRVRK